MTQTKQKLHQASPNSTGRFLTEIEAHPQFARQSAVALVHVGPICGHLSLVKCVHKCNPTKTSLSWRANLAPLTIIRTSFPSDMNKYATATTPSMQTPICRCQKNLTPSKRSLQAIAKYAEVSHARENVNSTQPDTCDTTRKCSTSNKRAK